MCVERLFDKILMLTFVISKHDALDLLFFFQEYKKEKEEEARIKMAHDPKMKRYRRWMNRGGPGQMTFMEEQFFHIAYTGYCKNLQLFVFLVTKKKQKQVFVNTLLVLQDTWWQFILPELFKEIEIKQNVNFTLNSQDARV